jgi:hypothetical protein
MLGGWDVGPLGVQATDYRNAGGEHCLEGSRDEAAGGIEPLGEGAGQIDGRGTAGVGRDGDGQIVDGDVLFGMCCDRDLLVPCSTRQS